jgi:hypothetical protein
MLISNKRYLADCLQRNFLDIYVVHFGSLEKPLNDKRTLVIHRKVLLSQGYRTTERLNCNFG